MGTIWQLSIVTDQATAPLVYGDEEALRAEVSAWKDYESSFDAYASQEAQESEGRKVRTVVGYDDPLCEKRIEVSYRPCDVVGMCLLQIR